MAAKRGRTTREEHDKQTRLRIYNVLNAVQQDRPEPTVSVTKVGGTDLALLVEARSRKHHILRVRLNWTSVANAHYIGYFVSADGQMSQAIISLYNQYDAAQFIVAVTLLGEIAARVPRKPRTPARRSELRR